MPWELARANYYYGEKTTVQNSNSVEQLACCLCLNCIPEAPLPHPLAFRIVVGPYFTWEGKFDFSKMYLGLKQIPLKAHPRIWKKPKYDNLGGVEGEDRAIRLDT